MLQEFCRVVVKLFLWCVYTILHLFRHCQESGQEEPSENHRMDYFSQEKSSFLKIFCFRRNLMERKFKLLHGMFQFFLRRVPQYEVENYFNSSVESKSTDNDLQLRRPNRTTPTQAPRPEEKQQEEKSDIQRKVPTLEQNTDDQTRESLPLKDVSDWCDDAQVGTETEVESPDCSENPSASPTCHEKSELLNQLSKTEASAESSGQLAEDESQICVETGEKRDQGANKNSGSPCISTPIDDGGTATIAVLDSKQLSPVNILASSDFQPEDDVSNVVNSSFQRPCDAVNGGLSVPTDPLHLSNEGTRQTNTGTDCEHAATASNDKALPVNPRENNSFSTIVTSSGKNHILDVNSSISSDLLLSTEKGLKEDTDSNPDHPAKLQPTHDSEVQEKSLTSRTANTDHLHDISKSGKNVYFSKESNVRQPINISVVQRVVTKPVTTSDDAKKTQEMTAKSENSKMALPHGVDMTSTDEAMYKPSNEETLDAKGRSTLSTPGLDKPTETDKCLHQNVQTSEMSDDLLHKSEMEKPPNDSCTQTTGLRKTLENEEQVPATNVILPVGKSEQPETADALCSSDGPGQLNGSSDTEDNKHTDPESAGSTLSYQQDQAMDNDREEERNDLSSYRTPKDSSGTQTRDSANHFYNASSELSGHESKESTDLLGQLSHGSESENNTDDTIDDTANPKPTEQNLTSDTED